VAKVTHDATATEREKAERLETVYNYVYNGTDANGTDAPLTPAARQNADLVALIAEAEKRCVPMTADAVMAQLASTKWEGCECRMPLGSKCLTRARHRHGL
jgi:hypothetical protein